MNTCRAASRGYKREFVRARVKRLKGEEVDRPPNFNIFMTFAAHSIGQPLSRYYLDYQVLVDANLAMVENFQVDLVQAISDPYREAVGFGAEVEFPQDGLPVSKVFLLADPSDIKMLKKARSSHQPAHARPLERHPFNALSGSMGRCRSWDG